jgi:ATP dependent DNA ligase C terminal region
VWVILASFTLRWRKHWPTHRERDQPNWRLQPSAAGTILSRPVRVLYAARLMIRSEKKLTQWALTKEEMKNCVWLKPELVAQIEFTEWTPNGHLRHSKFVGLEKR